MGDNLSLSLSIHLSMIYGRHCEECQQARCGNPADGYDHAALDRVTYARDDSTFLPSSLRA